MSLRILVPKEDRILGFRIYKWTWRFKKLEQLGIVK